MAEGGEGPATYIAFERLLSCVRSHMDYISGLAEEGFSTAFEVADIFLAVFHLRMICIPHNAY